MEFASVLNLRPLGKVFYIMLIAGKGASENQKKGHAALVHQGLQQKWKECTNCNGLPKHVIDFSEIAFQRSSNTS